MDVLFEVGDEFMKQEEEWEMQSQYYYWLVYFLLKVLRVMNFD